VNACLDKYFNDQAFDQYIKDQGYDRNAIKKKRA
jgi:hypothetical protein